MTALGVTPDGTDWDGHWRRYARATDLNPGQRYRRSLIRRLLVENGAGSDSRIVDIGSGVGDLLSALAQAFPDAAFAGIERSEEGVQRTQALLPSACLVRADIVADRERLAPIEDWATHAVCSEVLEHTETPAGVLAAGARCLRAGGAMIVTVPGGPRTAFDRSIGHLRHYTRGMLEDAIADAGLIPSRILSAGFPFFNLYRLAVLLRGDKLADDIDGDPSALARCVMALFRGLERRANRVSRIGDSLVE